MDIFVSIVIITKNQKHYIEQSLRAIQGQSYKNYEIIIVDSGSTDGARELYRRYPDVQVVSIPAVSPSEFNYIHALNQGVQAAKGEIIAKLSGDAIPANPYWLDSLIKPFYKKSTAAVYSNYLLRNNASYFEKLQHFFLMGNGRKVFRDMTHIVGASWAFREALWQQYGPAEKLKRSEESHFAWEALRHGYEVVYEPTSKIYHTHGRGSLQDIKEFAKEVVSVTSYRLSRGKW